jgi:predicted lipoprotein with Yx(FWY)xxD motif
MPRKQTTGARSSGLRRGKCSAAVLIAAIAGFALAALTGLAIAKSFTIGISKNAKVTNMIKKTSTRENVYTDTHGVAVYTLTHDTIQHPGCTKANGCFGFWFPVTVPSKNTKLTKASGIKGTLALFHRNGFFQVTLDKHPLYTFKLDNKRKGVATGEGIPSFGGIWHVEVDATKKSTKTTTTSPPMMTTTGTMPCLYPPC